LKKLLIIFLLLTIVARGQHHNNVLQYMVNGVLYNPAYCGSQQALNVTGLYRNQWVGLDGAPELTSFSAHTPLKNKKLNIGLVAENEKVGLFNSTRLNLLYAYRLKLKKGGLSFGVSGGLNTYTTNWDRLITTDQNDPNFNRNATRENVLTVGAGVYYRIPRFYAGLSSPELYTQSNSVQKEKTLVFTSGILCDLSNVIKCKPAALVMYLPQSTSLINVSTTFYYKELLGIGVGYNVQSSLIGLFDLSINEQFKIGYAYEYSTSALRTYNSGSHEIMLRYLFSYKVKAVSARYF
jgi:type IX secretion system PorP/SprF family membrane protein